MRRHLFVFVSIVMLREGAVTDSIPAGAVTIGSTNELTGWRELARKQ